MEHRRIITPELTTEEAYRLVDIIKNGSDYAGMLVMKSIANTLKYVTYSRANYKWNLKDKKLSQNK
jgi:hypothetical protein